MSLSAFLAIGIGAVLGAWLRYGWAAGAASLHLFGSLAMTGLGILTIHKLAQ